MYWGNKGKGRRPRPPALNKLSSGKKITFNFPPFIICFSLEKSQRFIVIKISQRVTVTKRDIKLVDCQPGQSRSIKINLCCGYLDRLFSVCPFK